MSVFIHATVSPTAAFASAGLNAWLPNVDAPLGMVTDDDAPADGDCGVGDGDGGGE